MKTKVELISLESLNLDTQEFPPTTDLDSASKATEILKQLWKELTEQEKRVLEYLENNKNQEEIAKELDLSQSKVSRVLQVIRKKTLKIQQNLKQSE